jgi:methoxymalonate biosynthesis acyl carrier protein
MTQEEIVAAVGRFVAKHLRTELGPDDPIFGSGLANSLFSMQLVLFVEREFAISVLNEDLEMSNFETIGSIARLVAHKIGVAG